MSTSNVELPVNRRACESSGDGFDRVTPPEYLFNRRQFIKTGAVAGISMSTLAQAGAQEAPASLAPGDPLDLPLAWPAAFAFDRNESMGLPPGAGEVLTSRRAAATHNNYYEFLPGRAGPVWEHAGAFKVEPWEVVVGGECRRPATFDLDDLFRFPHEERLCHFRCVERWAMNVPWVGFPLRRLLERVEPTSHARFVRFETAHRPEQMPGVREGGGRSSLFPYVEALRMDEAMHEFALLATGVYGEPLPKQHGAPVRVIVPWKYGYKNPKSIVKIDLTREQPKCAWSSGPQAHEYGYLSNVNPNIPHPRWSQTRSYWVDRQEEWFETPIFNGYESQVAGLYPDEPRTTQPPLEPGDIAR